MDECSEKISSRGPQQRCRLSLRRRRRCCCCWHTLPRESGKQIFTPSSWNIRSLSLSVFLTLSITQSNTHLPSIPFESYTISLTAEKSTIGPSLSLCLILTFAYLFSFTILYFSLSLSLASFGTLSLSLTHRSSQTLSHTLPFFLSLSLLLIYRGRCLEYPSSCL